MPAYSIEVTEVNGATIEVPISAVDVSVIPEDPGTWNEQEARTRASRRTSALL